MTHASTLPSAAPAAPATRAARVESPHSAICTARALPRHAKCRSIADLAPVIVVLALTAMLFSGCAQDDTDGYRATIRRTSHGIAHIEADTLANLGFGEGYAHAEDHFCSLADVVVRARGERAKYFGRGDNDAHWNNDVAMKGLRMHELAAAEVEAMDATTRGWFDGYVSGVNQYLEETGRDALPGWCRGAAWVAPITVVDLAAYQRSVTTILGRFDGMIASAQPPSSASSEPGGEAVSRFVPSWSALAQDIEADQASNGWGIGKERSALGGGMLVANPHYPWLGANRFWEKHLTLTEGSPDGVLDVYGVGLVGIPGVAIGFNRAVAWTHTVSAGTRYTAYKLTLNPENPTQYRYDDSWRDLEARVVKVEVGSADGDGSSTESVEHTVWMSHHGAVVNFPGVGWNDQMVLAVRDANEDNSESRMQWLDMDRAKTLEEFQEAHSRWGGLPWVNTISASADGRAWYTDSSSTPNLSDEAMSAWQQSLIEEGMAKSFWARGIVLLDGSKSMFEWQPIEGARDPGVAGFAQMPQTTRADYVFNANDSYWLNNSQALLTGYSPLMGGEATVRTLRTRMNDLVLGDTSATGASGEDGKFDLDEMSAAILSNRSLAAELLKDELVLRCRKQPRFQIGASLVATGIAVDLSEACEVLAAWDGHYNLDSRGAALFREWITQYDIDSTLDRGELFEVAFDPANPVATPNTMTKGALALERLAKAVQLLEDRGYALDVPLGEIQYAERGGHRIPMHGGDGTYEGIANFVRSHRNATTLEPMIDPTNLESSRFLTEKGYPVNSGTSFIMALAYQPDGTPRAQAFLTYGQSGDPSSEHFWDQTELFSKKQWRPIRFSATDVAADTKTEKVVKSSE